MIHKTTLIGYRYYATGVFGYSFYKGKDDICSVSGLVVPDFPVIIRGETKEWEYKGGKVVGIYGASHYKWRGGAVNGEKYACGFSTGSFASIGR